jgi:hypothetical protein
LLAVSVPYSFIPGRALPRTLVHRRMCARRAGEAKTEALGRRLPQDTLGRSGTAMPPSLSSVHRQARRHGQAAGVRLCATAPHRTIALWSNVVPGMTRSLPWCSSVCASTRTLVISPALAPKPRHQALLLQVRRAEPRLYTVR